MKVDHYNAIHPAEEPLQIVFNFEEDVAEMKLAKEESKTEKLPSEIYSNAPKRPRERFASVVRV